jgi:hypothetical protein
MKSKRREQNKQDASNVQCQKCLQMGHYTYQCKNERVFVTRPSRSKQLKENLNKRRSSSSPSDSDDHSDSDDYAPPPTYNARGIDTFRFKLDRAHHIVNKKKKRSDMERKKRRRRSSTNSNSNGSETSSSSETSSTTTSSSYNSSSSSSSSSSSDSSSYSSTSDTDEANTKPLDKYGKKRKRSHKSDRTTVHQSRNEQSQSVLTEQMDYKSRRRRSPTPSPPIERIESSRHGSLSPQKKNQPNTRDSL